MVNCFTCGTCEEDGQIIVRNPDGTCCCQYPKCEKFEHYSRCSSKCREIKCNSATPNITMCHHEGCVKGCFCDDGYARDDDGSCKPIVDCPLLRCPTNERYSQCDANGCQATCRNPKLPMVCRAMCFDGCICLAGYLRNDKRECVESKDCNQLE